MQTPLHQTSLWQNFQTDLGLQSFHQNTPDFEFLAILESTPFGKYLYLPYGPHLKTPPNQSQNSTPQTQNQTLKTPNQSQNSSSPTQKLQSPIPPQKNPAKLAYKALQDLAKQQNAIFIRIEPKDPKTAKYLLTRPNCQKSKDLSPSTTQILDLTADEDTLLKNMKQNTRNICRNFAKKDIKIILSTKPQSPNTHSQSINQPQSPDTHSQSPNQSTKPQSPNHTSPNHTSPNPSDLNTLIKLHTAVASHNKFLPFPAQYLKTEASQPFSTLYLAKHNHKTIAAALFFDHDRTRYYMRSASDPKYKNLPATTALLWTAIKDAKQNGQTSFDFWGIAPENADHTHPWYGFTKFKQSFGGQQKTYAGTYDLVLRPARYKLYKTFRSLNRRLRKLFLS